MIYWTQHWAAHGLVYNEATEIYSTLVQKKSHPKSVSLSLIILCHVQYYYSLEWVEGLTRLGNNWGKLDSHTVAFRAMHT